LQYAVWLQDAWQGAMNLLNRKKSFAEEMAANDRYYLRESLKKHGVTLYKNVVIDSFSPHGVKFHITAMP